MADPPPSRAAELADEISSSCLGMRTRMLDRVVSGIYDGHLRGSGVRISQVSLLTAIARAGEAGPADLCRWLIMEKSTVSRAVDRMVGEGWIETTEAVDGRSYRLRLTRAGRTKLLGVREPWRAAQAEVRALLDDGGADNLAELARRINATLP